MESLNQFETPKQAIYGDLAAQGFYLPPQNETSITVQALLRFRQPEKFQIYYNRDVAVELTDKRKLLCKKEYAFKILQQYLFGTYNKILPFDKTPNQKYILTYIKKVDPENILNLVERFYKDTRKMRILEKNDQIFSWCEPGIETLQAKINKYISNKQKQINDINFLKIKEKEQQEMQTDHISQISKIIKQLDINDQQKIIRSNDYWVLNGEISYNHGILLKYYNKKQIEEYQKLTQNKYDPKTKLLFMAKVAQKKFPQQMQKNFQKVLKAIENNDVQKMEVLEKKIENIFQFATVPKEMFYRNDDEIMSNLSENDNIVREMNPTEQQMQFQAKDLQQKIAQNQKLWEQYDKKSEILSSSPIITQKFSSQSEQKQQSPVIVQQNLQFQVQAFQKTNENSESDVEFIPEYIETPLQKLQNKNELIYERMKEIYQILSTPIANSQLQSQYIDKFNDIITKYMGLNIKEPSIIHQINNQLRMDLGLQEQILQQFQNDLNKENNFLLDQNIVMDQKIQDNYKNFLKNLYLQQKIAINESFKPTDAQISWQKWILYTKFAPKYKDEDFEEIHPLKTHYLSSILCQIGSEALGIQQKEAKRLVKYFYFQKMYPTSVNGFINFISSVFSPYFFSNIAENNWENQQQQHQNPQNIIQIESESKDNNEDNIDVTKLQSPEIIYDGGQVSIKSNDSISDNDWKKKKKRRNPRKHKDSSLSSENSRKKKIFHN